MTAAVALALALGLAAGLDWRFGEPRNAWHPVAWLGRLLTPLGRRLPGLPPGLALAAGLTLWWLVIATVGLLALAVQGLLLSLAPWLAIPLLALALKPAFAWRMLHDEVAGVETALQSGGGLESGLQAGRDRLARLCSRDVSGFTAEAIRETAIESLAENLNDSLVAPLFWTVLAGLPGAWIWRATNTMDAMWGYRGPWEWAGKFAARADDVLGWLPARLTAMLLWRSTVSLSVLRREAARTPSPNGGWPMAAMALRLGVRLGKPGVYRLNPVGRAPDAAAVAAALAAARQAALAAFVIAILGLLLAPAAP